MSKVSCQEIHGEEILDEIVACFYHELDINH